MIELSQRDLKSRQVVLVKGQNGFFPLFFTNWQIDEIGCGPVCNNLLYPDYGNITLYSKVFSLSEDLELFKGNKLSLGDIILVFTGGYNLERYPDLNWSLGYYCGSMNGKILAARSYSPRTKKFSLIKEYPAMGVLAAGFIFIMIKTPYKGFLYFFPFF